MTWMQTYTGKSFNYLDFNADDICIEDIAHHLCEIPRFTGALKIRYNVLSHSINVARWVYHTYKGKIPNEGLKQLLIEALLHDAGEAYIGDICTPLKRFLGDGIKHLEDNILKAISQKFNIHHPFSRIVKEADAMLCGIEAVKLLAHPPVGDWHLMYIRAQSDLQFKLFVTYNKENFINILTALQDGKIEVLEGCPGAI